MSLGFPPRSARKEDVPRWDNPFPSSNLFDHARTCRVRHSTTALKAAVPFASSASMIVGDDQGVGRPGDAVAHERGQSRRRQHQRARSHTRSDTRSLAWWCDHRRCRSSFIAPLIFSPPFTARRERRTKEGGSD